MTADSYSPPDAVCTLVDYSTQATAFIADDIETLLPGKWLTAPALSRLLIDKVHSLNSFLPNEDKTAVFDSTFFVMKRWRTMSPEFKGKLASRRSCVEYDLFARALIPVHVGSNHWILAVLNRKLATVLIYDSLYNCTSPSQYISDLREFIYLALGKRVPIETLQFIHAGEHHTTTQADGFNCGVFTVYNAMRYLEAVPHPETETMNLVDTRFPVASAGVSSYSNNLRLQYYAQLKLLYPRLVRRLQLSKSIFNTSADRLNEEWCSKANKNSPSKFESAVSTFPPATTIPLQPGVTADSPTPADPAAAPLPTSAHSAVIASSSSSASAQPNVVLQLASLIIVEKSTQLSKPDAVIPARIDESELMYDSAPEHLPAEETTKLRQRISHRAAQKKYFGRNKDVIRAKNAEVQKKKRATMSTEKKDVEKQKRRDRYNSRKEQMSEEENERRKEKRRKEDKARRLRK